MLENILINADTNNYTLFETTTQLHNYTTTPSSRQLHNYTIIARASTIIIYMGFIRYRAIKGLIQKVIEILFNKNAHPCKLKIK